MNMKIDEYVKSPILAYELKTRTMAYEYLGDNEDGDEVYRDMLGKTYAIPCFFADEDDKAVLCDLVTVLGEEESVYPNTLHTLGEFYYTESIAEATIENKYAIWPISDRYYLILYFEVEHKRDTALETEVLITKIGYGKTEE